MPQASNSTPASSSLSAASSSSSLPCGRGGGEGAKPALLRARRRRRRRNRGFALASANTIAETYGSLAAARDEEEDEEDPDVARRRRSEEALMSGIEFDAIWITDKACRAKVTGEGGGNEQNDGFKPSRARRRPGTKPTASDLAREAAAKAAAEATAHPAAELFEDSEYRRTRVATLYHYLAPALTPRDMPPGTGDGGGVARGLAKIPLALHDLDPRRAAAVLVHLRETHGDAADLVGIVTADPSVLLSPLPGDGEDEEARAARRRRRLEAARVAAASTAANRVVARVGARVGTSNATTDLEDGGQRKTTGVMDGREDGKWRVQGTYKGTSNRDEDLKVRFWNLWGGSSECRKAVTSSSRGSVFRDPARMEAAVTRLDRYMPFVDAPMLLHRSPALLELSSEELVRRAARVKMTLRGGDAGRVLGLAPSLLLATEEEFSAAIEGVAAEVTSARSRKGKSKLSPQSAAMQRAVYEAATAILRDGGAESLLARGAASGRDGASGRVVLVTEKAASVHVS